MTTCICDLQTRLFFTDQDKVAKVTYYKIIETGVDGTGEGLAQLVIQHFRMDGILDAVVRRLKGCTSDGANVMYGHKVTNYHHCMIRNILYQHGNFVFRVALPSNLEKH